MLIAMLMRLPIKAWTVVSVRLYRGVVCAGSDQRNSSRALHSASERQCSTRMLQKHGTLGYDSIREGRMSFRTNHVERDVRPGV